MPSFSDYLEMPSFSDYIVFVDESGDHGLVSVDPSYPIFVLAFCIFPKVGYADRVVPSILHFKFRHFGHDQVVLHERDIRKSRSPFDFLIRKERREPFYEELNQLVEDSKFDLVASVIQKQRLRTKYSIPGNPYHLAMSFGLERIYLHLKGIGCERGTGAVHILFERRGKKEDDELELEFRRVCENNATGERLPFTIVMVDKKSNSSGLQLADLVARPIGRHVLEPRQPNRAYGILKEKFRTDEAGRVEGWGIKIFP